MLKVNALNYSIRESQILNNISAEFLPGKFNMIVGPNGSGKSTFLKICNKDIKDFSGGVYFNDQKVDNINIEHLATFRACLTHQTEVGFPLSVEEVIMMGRYPHFSHAPTQKDREICEQAIQLLKLQKYRHRNYLTLSGGEKQRVQFCRILCQIWEIPKEGYRYLFLDEPLTNLDIKFQQEILQITQSLINERTVVVAVMHDLNLTFQYSDEIFFFKSGSIFFNGPTEKAIDPFLINDVFDIEVDFIINPKNQKPLMGLRHKKN